MGVINGEVPSNGKVGLTRPLRLLLLLMILLLLNVVSSCEVRGVDGVGSAVSRISGKLGRQHMEGGRGRTLFLFFPIVSCSIEPFRMDARASTDVVTIFPRASLRV